MLVTTPVVVSPALSSGSAIEEMGANTAGEKTKVADAYETTRVDEGGGARGSETLVIAIVV